MNKTEAAARKIMGWTLNRWDRWYDPERGVFIPVSEFRPEENLDDAMLLVERLETFGFTYTAKEDGMVCFNGFCDGGETLAQAITNAASLIASEGASLADEWI